jgi:hypothetical protein
MKLLIKFLSDFSYTVEPPNKGQVGAWALVHYLGVVLYWGFFVKKPFLCVVRYNNDYYYKCTNQSWNSSSYNLHILI